MSARHNRLNWMKPVAVRAEGASLSTHEMKRIALISPWAGGNLGNATIIAAVISNIYKRIPDAEIFGVTLAPGDTRRRYAVQAFPLTAVSRPYHPLIMSEDSDMVGQRFVEYSRIRQWVKRRPFIRRILKGVYAWLKELAHILAAARLVRRLDRVIVPGGGALDEFWGGAWGHPWSLFKWSVLSRIYRVPFLFVSVGKCSLESRTSRFFARIALRFASYRSYRDPDSKAAVRSLADAENDPVYPDLAFSYPCTIDIAYAEHDSATGRLVVGVSPIAYCNPRGWPLSDERRYAAYTKELSAMVRWLLLQGHNVFFFVTDSLDTVAVEDVRAHLKDGLIDVANISDSGSPMNQSIDEHLRKMSEADIVIASRLHGVILAHLSGTPALAVSFDPKVDAHMNGIGQQAYCLSIDHLQLDRLVNRFETLRVARHVERERLRSAVLVYRQELDLQYDRLLVGR